MLLRTWTTTLFLASALLFACGGDDDGGGGDGSDGDSADTDGGGGGSDAGDQVDTDAGDDTADAAGGDFEGIPCGGDTCTAGEEVCCAGGEGGLNCTSECDTIPFGCDGPEDCAGAEDICCGTGEEGTQCLPAAECGGQGDGEIICHEAADCRRRGTSAACGPRRRSVSAAPTARVPSRFSSRPTEEGRTPRS
jgi:hypothetical protein